MDIPHFDAPTNRDVASEPWALLWSQSDCCLHKEPLLETMGTNLAMLRGTLSANDYLLLYVGSMDSVHAMAQSLTPLADARAEKDRLLRRLKP